MSAPQPGPLRAPTAEDARRLRAQIPEHEMRAAMDALVRLLRASMEDEPTLDAERRNAAR